MRLISVVLPVYREADNIQPCLRGLWGALQGVEHEILVCYDLDEDPTLEAIAAMADRPPSVRLVKNDFGRGAANAIRAGFAAARGDAVITTMADLCDPPERIVALAQELRRSGAAVVSGSRYMPGGSQQGGPLLKRLLSRYSSLVLRWLSGIGTHDATNNFRAYSRDFLGAAQIETRRAFDIGLELTVKAHLAGRIVSEVPTSWVDRQAGSSQFRMWAWMPQYLRWWLLALREPLLAWTLGALAWSWAWFHPHHLPGHPLGPRAGATLVAAAAAAGMLLARRIRGRTRWWDGAHCLFWLGPWIVGWYSGRVSRAAECSLAASVLLLAATPGWRAALSALRQALTQTSLGRLCAGAAAVACGAAAWFANFLPAQVDLRYDLDPSWHRAYSYFFEHGWRAGVDYVFTYGPLGFAEYGSFSPALYWTETLFFEVLVKGAAACVLAWTIFELPSWWLRLPLAFLVVFFSPSQDAYLMVVSMCSAIMLLRPRAPGPLKRAALLALMWTTGMVKFSLFLLAGWGSVAVVAGTWAALGWRAAAKLAATAGAAAVGTWCLVGQRPFDLVPYVRGALEVANGYDDAMALGGPLRRVFLGLAMGCFLALALGLNAWRDGWKLQSLNRALYALGCAYLAWKAGFVRHGGSVHFFLPCSALLLIAGWPSGGAESGRSSALGSKQRLWCAAVAAVALLSVFVQPIIEDHGLKGVRWILEDRIVAARTSWHRLGMADQIRTEESRWLLEFQRSVSMPRTARAIGTGSLDVIPENQALAILNGFHWNPRPTFQSYSAYTSKLAAGNRRHYLDPAAPRFVLSSYSGLDERYPPMDDGPVLEELIPRYRPVLFEKGHLLLERRADSPSPWTKAVVSTHELSFGETLRLDAVEAEALQLRFDVRMTLLGRMRAFFYGAARVHMQVEYESGWNPRFLILPELAREGLLVRPSLLQQVDTARLYAGQYRERIVAVRLVIQPWHRKWFQPRVRAEIVRLDGWLPRPDPALMDRVIEQTCQPSADMPVTTLGDMLEDADYYVVLRASPPHDLELSLPAGSWLVTGKAGSRNDRFRASDLREPARMWIESEGATGRKILFEQTWDLQARLREELPTSFRLLIGLDEPARVSFRCEGPPGRVPSDMVWEGLRLVRLELDANGDPVLPAEGG
jgi:hypothetical protein